VTLKSSSFQVSNTLAFSYVERLLSQARNVTGTKKGKEKKKFIFEKDIPEENVDNT